MPDLPERLTNAWADFLLTDLDTALIFMDVAATSASQKTRNRNHENAHHAYQTVLRLLGKVTPDAPQWADINQKLALLKERLENAGYRF